jgi:hypothetical protein
MAKFPVDAPLRKVISSLEQLGFQYHPVLKKSTLRTILTQSKISRDEFLKVYFS